MNPKIIKYVKDNLQKGYSREAITKALLQTGYTRDMILDIFNYIDAEAGELPSKEQRYSNKVFLIIAPLVALLITLVLIILFVMSQSDSLVDEPNKTYSTLFENDEKVKIQSGIEIEPPQYTGNDENRAILADIDTLLYDYYKCNEALEKDECGDRADCATNILLGYLSIEELDSLFVDAHDKNEFSSIFKKHLKGDYLEFLERLETCQKNKEILEVRVISENQSQEFNDVDIDVDIQINETCEISSEFGCSVMVLRKNRLILTINNGLGKEIKNVNLNVCESTVALESMVNGISHDFVIPCDVDPGEILNSSLTLVYDVDFKKSQITYTKMGGVIALSK